MNPIRRLTVPLLALAAASTWAADPIRIDAQPTFSGPMADTTSVTVSIENDGPDARGVLSVSGDAGTTQYPVELPRGSRKKVLTLPGVGYGELRFQLDTDRGSVARTMPSVIMGDATGGTVALIGDDSGGLAFLRRQTLDEKRAVAARDAYAEAESAPGRPIAYKGYNAVVLGPGAERMGDETVAALKDYALGGGTLIFLGGASAPILEDRRWASALPGREWRPVTLASSPALGRIGGVTVSTPFTVLAPGKLASGASARKEGQVPLESERGFGLGRVVVLGYSPLEAPLNAWDGRTRALSRFIRTGETMRARQFVNTYLNSSSSEGYNSYSPGVVRTMVAGPGTYARSPYASSVSEDPFSMQLPPTGTVFGILAGYFILVVPVSFLILRKLKRGELAWITAPVLSLGFAGVLFTSAQGLYSAALSTASQGVLVLQQGSPDAMFYGTSQVFFPRGGVYDLKLRNIDSMSSVQRNPYGYGGSEALAGFNPVDVGEVVAPKLEANNLAFRELSYAQRVDDADWFRFERLADDQVRVENRSPYGFSGYLANGPFASKPVTLEPGARATVNLAEGDTIPEGSPLSPQDPRIFTRQSGRMALSGTLRGFRPGPQIGNEIKGRNGVNVIAFAQEKAR